MVYRLLDPLLSVLSSTGKIRPVTFLTCCTIGSTVSAPPLSISGGSGRLPFRGSVSTEDDHGSDCHSTLFLVIVSKLRYDDIIELVLLPNEGTDGLLRVFT